MNNSPAPLVPAEVDLTDFAFMPLQVERLRRSRAWLKCKRNPALAFYMVNLWTASWHEVPAGSIENDDDVLADLAMCDPSKWDKVKADALHGWVLCSDGRLYNPTVCEKAREAWDAKLDQRWRTECARIKKHADRHHIAIPRPTFEEWMAAGCPCGQRLPVPRDTSGTSDEQGREMPSKGQGEGQREGEGQGQGDLKTSVPDGTDAAASAGRSERAGLGANGLPPGHPDHNPGCDPGTDSGTGHDDDDADPPSPPAAAKPRKAKKDMTPEEREKSDIWHTAVLVLQQGGCKVEGACRTFMGKLVQDYTFPVVREAVAAAVVAQPPEAREFLVAACQRIRGERPGRNAPKTAVQQRAESLAKAARLLQARAAAAGHVVSAADLAANPAPAPALNPPIPQPESADA